MKKKYLKSLSILLFLICPNMLYADGIKSAGVSLGTPALLNFVLKGEVMDIPLQISGGYWGEKIVGVQIGYSFYQGNSFFNSTQLIVGHSEVEDNVNSHHIDKWSYVGISATYKTGRFYIEPGITIGTGDYSNPQLVIQLGWLWDM